MYPLARGDGAGGMTDGHAVLEDGFASLNGTKRQLVPGGNVLARGYAQHRFALFDGLHGHRHVVCGVNAQRVHHA